MQAISSYNISMITPKKFVGLHAHSVFSTFDALAYPQEHIDFVIENGMDAWALTDHGHANGYAHAYLHAKKLNGSGKSFKFIGGVEAYYHPDLEQWNSDVVAAKVAKEEAKAAAKRGKPDDGSDTDDSIDEESMTIENESESKNVSKWFNPVNRRHHLVLLPKSRIGLENIFALITRSYKEGFYKFPRIDHKMLKQHSEGIIASTACLGGPISYAVFYNFRHIPQDELTPSLLDDPKAMNDALRAVGNAVDPLFDALGKDNVYLEIQFNKIPAQHLVNRAILEFAKREGLQLIATADSHYCRPEFWKAREMYKNLGWLGYENINPDCLPKSIEDLKCELYPKNAEQMWAAYQDYCGRYSFYDDEIVARAIENTWHIAHDVIGDVSPDTSIKLPTYVIPPNANPFRALVDAVKEGLRNKGLDKKKEYIDRAKYELDVIKDRGFELYFLTMKSIFNIASKHVLVGPGRGSAGGSLILYLLGVTQLDPIRHELLFERFCTKQRLELPDVDSDLADRDLVIEKLREEFGPENVIPISNYNTLQLKSLTKDVSKFYGIPFNEANEGVSTVESDVRGATMGAGDDKNLFVLTYDDALKYSTKYREYLEKYPQVAEHLQVLYKQVRSIGRHAGGVLVAENLQGKLPMIAVKGELQTPWVEGVSVKHLNEFGFCKFDLLGLETLRIIHVAIEHILRRHHGIKNPTFSDISKWFDENLHPDKLDLNDVKVYENVYQAGRFCATFQYTSQGAQKFIQRFKPTCLEDIAIATSIYRPGPLAAKVDEIYLKNKTNLAAAEADEHPRVWETLKSTAGCIIFQESLMQLAVNVAGFSPEDSERVRKTILKQSISAKGENKKKRAQIREEFVAGCIKHSKMTNAEAEALFDKIEFFCGYGFNRSHAVAYAIDSYYCAWLQTYYEAEWCAAYLETSSNNPDKLSRAIKDVRALGYNIKKLDINYASHTWTIVDNERAFVPSFYSVKGIGPAAIEEIIQNRPYTSVENLLWNDEGAWRHSKFNKKVMENLIKIGAFESMNLIGEGKKFKSYRQMHHVLVENSDTIKKTPKKDPGYGKRMLNEMIESTQDLDDWSTIEKITFLKDLTGDVNYHDIVPQNILDALRQKDVLPINEHSGQNIYWFIIENVEVKKTKTGKQYLRLRVFAEETKRITLFLWGWTPDKHPAIQPYDLCVSEVEASDFGYSAKAWKLRVINNG